MKKYNQGSNISRTPFVTGKTQKLSHSKLANIQKFLLLLFLEIYFMPLFECKVCGRKIRTEYEVSCTGDVKRNIEKAPWCCGKEMIETIDD